jgi:hypothetical protein
VPGDERGHRGGRQREQNRQERQTVGHQAHRRERLGAGEQVAGQPLVHETDREREQLLHEHGQDEPHERLHRAGGAGTSAARLAGQANNSLITLPEFAIFIGRPFFAVNVVSSEMPSALSTLAMRSCEE